MGDPGRVRHPPQRRLLAVIGVAEIFYSVQGEGTWTGTPAVFVRLAGCNLSCDFCDTDYALRRMMSVEQIVRTVREASPERAMVVLTGGEPLAQAESLALVEALRKQGHRVHIESNGTIAAPLPDDVWLCVSPKERVDAAMARRANEAKLIVDGAVPEEHLPLFEHLASILLQPEGNKPRNVEIAVRYAQAHPQRFRLSLQTHKFIGIP
jgi:7-carboxy-7-deazaguanine synthase